MKKRFVVFLFALMLIIPAMVIQSNAFVGDNVVDECEPNNYSGQSNSASCSSLSSDWSVFGAVTSSDVDVYKMQSISDSKKYYYAVVCVSVNDAPVKLEVASNFYENKKADGLEFSQSSSEGYVQYYNIHIKGDNPQYLRVSSTENCEYMLWYYREPVEGHKHSYFKTYYQEPICAKGYREHQCICGASYRKELPAKYEHKFDDYVITKEATILADGKKVRSCINCGEKQSAVIPAPKSSVRNGWVNVDGYWCYCDETGTPVRNQWKTDRYGWCYLGADGKMVKDSWVSDSKGECYVDSKGHLLTNSWLTDKKTGLKTYVNGNGRRAYKDTWVYKSPNWLYIGSDGYAVKDQWVKDSKGWCYLDSDSYMVKNAWVKDSVGKCYIGPDGYILTNRWAKLDGQWVYLNNNGRKTTNAWVKDSQGWCYLGADGAMIRNGWATDSVGKCYIGPEGYILTNRWIKDDGVWVYLNSNGRKTTNAWIQDAKGWCYLDGTGQVAKNKWISDGGYKYYVDASGYMVTGKYVINGVTYTFSAGGRLIG